jgi:hypothetical protein
MNTIRKITLLGLLVLSLTACHRLKEKGEETLNDTGKAVGSGASHFIGGVKEGIDKTFESSMDVSDALKAKGLNTGKFAINHESSDSAYKVSVYCTFDKDFDNNIVAKVADKKGQEYGRSAIKVTAKAGEAKYIDILFDKRTEIESKSRFTLG